MGRGTSREGSGEGDRQRDQHVEGTQDGDTIEQNKSPHPMASEMLFCVIPE